MERIRLGRTGLEVSRICLGTMTFGEQNSEADAHAQLDYAVSRGINFVDTAEMYPIPVAAGTYGATERFIGSWLRNKPRERIVLASKVAGPGRGMDWVRGGERAGVPDLSKTDIVRACEGSLRRLGTDHIDLYQIHWPARYVPMFGANRFDPSKDRNAISIEEQLEAMDQLLRDGKIRAVGVSNETAWGVSAFAHAAERWSLPRIASIQNVYNLMSREFEHALIEACHREDVGLLAYSPLAFGWLTGKFEGGARPAGARLTRFGDRWPRYTKPGIPVAADEYAAIARRFGMSPARFALAFVYRRPFVASTIVGATSVEQLAEAIDAWSQPFTEEMLAAVDAVHARAPNPAP